MNRTSVKRLILLCCLFYTTLPAWTQAKTSISGTVEWDRMELRASVVLDLASLGLRIPSGRIQAEETLIDEYPRLILPALFSIPVNSSDTLGDLINRGEFSLPGVDNIRASAYMVPPSLSGDLTSLTAHYIIDLNRIGAALTRHSRPREIMRAMRPVPAASYTGIIVIAGEALPVHGRNSSALPVPCIFPKIWDSGMNLIYDKSIPDPQYMEKNAIVRYVRAESVFRPSPSGLSPELEALIGPNPLRILAKGVFGILPTDPIIDREDALTIISTENNRRLLREGRVAIVLNGEALQSPLQTQGAEAGF